MLQGPTSKHADIQVHCSLPGRSVVVAEEVVVSRFSHQYLDGSTENVVASREHLHWIGRYSQTVASGLGEIRSD
jgi:hypothetical protein